MHQLHDLLGYSLEALYSGMIFDIACERFVGNERTLDEFWYGVLENILMAYEDRRSDRSAARAKHVRLVLEELGMQLWVQILCEVIDG